MGITAAEYDGAGVWRARFSLPSDRSSSYAWNGQSFDVAGDLRRDIDAQLLAEAYFGLTSTLVMQRMTLLDPVLPHGDEVMTLADEIMDVLWSGVSPERGKR